MRNVNMSLIGIVAALVGLIVVATAHRAVAAGNAEAGARDFRVCASCHALESGRNLTGPSLAGIWGRKAATIESFPRYSEALKATGLVWDEKTLDRWLFDPKALVSGNYMVFRGVKDPVARSNIVAFLKALSDGSINPKAAANAVQGPQLLDLKDISGEQRVTSISYCRDTYRVTTEAGDTTPFWEF